MIVMSFISCSILPRFAGGQPIIKRRYAPLFTVVGYRSTLARWGSRRPAVNRKPITENRSIDSSRHQEPSRRARFSPVKIYTKTGDLGDTGLFGGGRVPKDDPRVEAYGDVDELNAVIGMARAVELMPRVDELLVPVQRDLFAIGALLATPDREKMAQHLQKARIDDRRIAELEQAIDDAEAELEPLRAFILPGGTPKAAALHVARTVCRRAERHVVRLQHTVELPGLTVIYLNRLSDLLFTLSRLANRRAGAGEVTW
jgi:cob(I)alamin adenosyltransferase